MATGGTRTVGPGGKGGGKARGGKAKATPPMTRDEVRYFLEALAAANPDPRSELSYTDPYTLLVAVALSAQTTDVAVNRATETLFKEAPDAKAMVALGVEGVGRHIRRLGLWQGKARNVVEMSRLLEERYGGAVPNDRAALEALPGVGRKTANVVLNVAFGEATMAVDTHIFRLGNRTGIAPGKTTREVEDGLVRRCPPDMLRLAHHWLILHGRYVCKARLPECWRCVAAEWCRFPAKTQAPAVTRAIKATQKAANRSPARPKAAKAATGKPKAEPKAAIGKRSARAKPKQASATAD